MATTKITKTLYIGLGGTGVMAILRTKQCFLDTYGEIPKMIGFLAIDTDGQAKNKFIISAKHGKVALDHNELLVCSVPMALQVYTNNRNLYSWIPSVNTDSLKTISADGAGQVRSNGRFIARFNAKHIQNQVQQKISNIAAPLPVDYRFQYDYDSNGNERPTIINVVGSTAGGTGSGMMLDILMLVSNAAQALGTNYRIYPWIVMPDVFRRMAPGVPSFNVHNNAFGFLQELDYLFHLPADNQNPLDFGFDRINTLDPNIRYAYIINNTNEKGVCFQSINELTDSIGRSMFLPSNQLGQGITSPMDNVAKHMKAFEVLNKKAWTASMGSAELIYDSQAVGDYIGYSMIKSACDELCKKNNNGLQNALTWMSDPNVAVQEHNADMLIDSLLDPICPFSPIDLSKDSDQNQIDNYIKAATESTIRKTYDNKICTVDKELDKYITNNINTQNGVGDIADFLSSLLTAIQTCEEEMDNEKKQFDERVNNHQPWNEAVNAIKNSGLPALFSPIDKDAAEALSEEIRMHVEAIRESIRRSYAIQVYAHLRQSIGVWQNKINALENTLQQVAKDMDSANLKIQRDAQRDLNFQVYIHGEEVNRTREATAQDILDFLKHQDIKSLIGLNNLELFEVMRRWANETQEVRAAFAVTINEYLQKVYEQTPEKANSYIEKVKVMASPLWKINTQGYVNQPLPLVKFILVGCADANRNIFKETKLANLFVESGHEPTYISTEEKNRILILIMSCCAPIYAVGNTTIYQREYIQTSLAGYIDEQWNLRMRSEKFNLMPTPPDVGPNKIEFWVKGFIFGLIHYDDGSQQYWIRSRQRGNPINHYRLDIGDTREVAYLNYVNMELYQDVKREIDLITKRKGLEHVKEVLNEVNSDNYQNDYSQLPDEEKRHLEDRLHYQALIELVMDEINLVADGL